MYEVAVKQDSGQLHVAWSAKQGQPSNGGRLVMRANLAATTASELWEKVHSAIQLTEVEATFSYREELQ